MKRYCLSRAPAINVCILEKPTNHYIFHRTYPHGYASSHARNQTACQKADCIFGFSLQANCYISERTAVPLTEQIHLHYLPIRNWGVIPQINLLCTVSDYSLSKRPSKFYTLIIPSLSRSSDGMLYWLNDRAPCMSQISLEQENMTCYQM